MLLHWAGRLCLILLPSLAACNAGKAAQIGVDPSVGDAPGRRGVSTALSSPADGHADRYVQAANWVDGAEVLATDTKGLPPEITFVTEGESFAPVVTTQGNARIRWTWADGTGSDLPNPTKTYGSSAQRKNRLRVDPWSAVRRINIGYDAEDGGDPTYERVPDQKVSNVVGLGVVAPYLEQWFSSFSRITSLDFSHFRQLRTIECLWSRSLKRLQLNDVPSLRRLCVEGAELAELDLSDAPKLEDLRGARNAFPDIRFGDTAPNLLHICVRDNPQLRNGHLLANGDRFPNLAEILVWNSNQNDTFALHSTNPDKVAVIIIKQNQYTALDLVGALKSRRRVWAILDASSNALERVAMQGCAQIKMLNLSNNRLSTAGVDSVLEQAVAWNTEEGEIDLRSNSAPSATGNQLRRTLEGRRWKITVDTH
jgi:hypothetical protein